MRVAKAWTSSWSHSGGGDWEEGKAVAVGREYRRGVDGGHGLMDPVLPWSLQSTQWGRSQQEQCSWRTERDRKDAGFRMMLAVVLVPILNYPNPTRLSQGQ